MVGRLNVLGVSLPAGCVWYDIYEFRTFCGIGPVSTNDIPTTRVGELKRTP